MDGLDLSKVVIARKFSVLEFDRKKLKMDDEQLRAYYQRIGADYTKIFDSFLAQKKTFETIASFFKNPKIIEGRTFKKDVCPEDSIIIILGGDNYFQYVSHFLDNQLVIGVNSDPKRSEGVLTYFNADNFHQAFEGLEKGEIKVEEWSRLQVILNDKKINSLALSEVYVGSKERFTVSKYRISYQGKEEEQKSSGVLVVTGSGSTGWYSSAKGSGEESSFDRNAKEARFLVTEIFQGKLQKNNIKEGVLKIGDELEITSLGRHKSVVSIDSKQNYPFPFGNKVKISLADTSLRVVSL